MLLVVSYTYIGPMLKQKSKETKFWSKCNVFSKKHFYYKCCKLP